MIALEADNYGTGSLARHALKAHSSKGGENANVGATIIDLANLCGIGVMQCTFRRSRDHMQ